MAENSKRIASKALLPVFHQFQRQAASAIEAVATEMRNVLRVKYDAEPECRPSGLPAPRLQLRWSYGDDGYEWHCSYEMVMPLRELDIRNDAATGFAVIELGRTRVGGGGAAPWQRESPDMCTPFRDGSHAKWDAVVMGGLPIYILGPDGSAQTLPNAAD